MIIVNAFHAGGSLDAGRYAPWRHRKNRITISHATRKVNSWTTLNRDL